MIQYNVIICFLKHLTYTERNSKRYLNVNRDDEGSKRQKKKKCDNNNKKNASQNPVDVFADFQHNNYMVHDSCVFIYFSTLYVYHLWGSWKTARGLFIVWQEQCICVYSRATVSFNNFLPRGFLTCDELIVHTYAWSENIMKKIEF